MSNIGGIKRSGGVSSTSKKKKTGKTGGSSFASHLSETSGSDTTEATESLSSAVGLDALLSIQSAGQDQDEHKERRAAIRQGHDLLESLDQLRLDILSGRVSYSKLQVITQNLQDRADPNDPNLCAILKEIYLRAQVELAKYSMGR